MLVFVSDLHFVDGTAGEHNVPTKAFDRVFHDLAAHARKAEAKEITIVFLGDIFDLLRTEMWFDVPEEERPWGMAKNKTKKMAAHTERILDAILDHSENKKTFELLSGDLKGKEYGFPCEPERIYIPGNHDRICAQFPSLFKKCQQALGAKNSQPLHLYTDPRYGVFACHGHEYDVFNFEGENSFDDQSYLKAPIGDPITTELVTRLPYVIMRHEKIKKLSKKKQENLKKALQEIQNVRPLAATLKWLFYQVSMYDWLSDVIEEALEQVIEDFHALKFVNDWYRRHDCSTHPWDEADQIQTALFFLRKLKITRAEAIFSLGGKIIEMVPDPLRTAVPKEFQRLGSDIYYVVYGHTHEPLQLPVEVVSEPDEKIRELVYLNTGTWRAWHQEALVRGFITWKLLTYTIFYTMKEDIKNKPKRDFPAFETWTGTLKQTVSQL